MDKTSAPSKEHSTLIGGSNCRARMACPASYQMEQRLPISARRESTVYADEGSALHEAIANILYSDLDPQDMLGHSFTLWKDHPITQEHIDEALKPCVELYDRLDASYGPLAFLCETRVSIPSLPGLFGTCDLIAKGRDRTIIIDWKFGVGEKVHATYEDGNPNAQLMFYALGAYRTRPEMFAPGCEINLWVAQPRHRDGPHFDVVVIDPADLDDFERSLTVTYAELQATDPHLEAGDHCRFMACRAVCPKHTGPIFEVPLVISPVTRNAVEKTALDWQKAYPLMLAMAERIEPVLAEWRRQAQAHLEAGGTIEGYKLVPKRATRKWTADDAAVEKKLAKLGLKKDERMPRVLVSPPQAEKLLGKGKLPEGYYDAVSSGVTLAKAGDFRHDAEPVGVLASALASLLGDLR